MGVNPHFYGSGGFEGMLEDQMVGVWGGGAYFP